MRDLVAHEPMVAAAQAAARAAGELVPRIAPDAVEVASDLVASLAIMECCAAEAAVERGRTRRKLCDIARGKAARSRCALDIAVARGILRGGDVTDARDALDDTLELLAPPRRPALLELFRGPT
jgi:hypothetical protein